VNQNTEPNGRTTASHRPDTTSNDAQAGDWPSREERLGLIREYQGNALQRGDPHVANLKMFDGDVMLMALWARFGMENELVKGESTPESSRRFGQRADMLLRCVRQITRNAGIIDQLTKPPEGNPPAG
jgi:hypothetical protein